MIISETPNTNDIQNKNLKHKIQQFVTKQDVDKEIVKISNWRCLFCLKSKTDLYLEDLFFRLCYSLNNNKSITKKCMDRWQAIVKNHCYRKKLANKFSKGFIYAVNKDLQSLQNLKSEKHLPAKKSYAAIAIVMEREIAHISRWRCLFSFKSRKTLYLERLVKELLNKKEITDKDKLRWKIAKQTSGFERRLKAIKIAAVDKKLKNNIESKLSIVPQTTAKIKTELVRSTWKINAEEKTKEITPKFRISEHRVNSPFTKHKPNSSNNIPNNISKILTNSSESFYSELNSTNGQTCNTGSQKLTIDNGNNKLLYYPKNTKIEDNNVFDKNSSDKIAKDDDNNIGEDLFLNETFEDDVGEGILLNETFEDDVGEDLLLNETFEDDVRDETTDTTDKKNKTEPNENLNQEVFAINLQCR